MTHVPEGPHPVHRLTAAIVSLLALAVPAAPAWAGRADRIRESDAVLRMDRLLTVRIRMSADRWKMMQPEKASRLATALAVIQRPTTRQAVALADSRARVAAGAFEDDEQIMEAGDDDDLAPASPARDDWRPPVEGQRRPPGLVGNQYAYVKATVEIDGQPLREVGVRFKGQWSYNLGGATPRRPLKLKFDHFVEDQDFYGVRSLSLSSNAADPSLLRETLGFALFRDAGIPAPRTCLALVYLTVDGLYDEEPLGLYTAIEEVNKDFLRRCFGTTKGLLVRPERVRNLAYLGGHWSAYDQRYNVQTPATPFTAERFVGFTRLVNREPDEGFGTLFGSYLEADEFLRFVAANVVMVNLDGVLVNGHNFYVHVHPETGRLSFIPWDLHFSHGGHGQTMDEWAGLTIERPFRPTNRLVERLLTVGHLRDAYREHLRDLATGAFSPQRMHERIDLPEKVVEAARARSKALGKEMPPAIDSTPPRPRPDLKPFVTARVRSVLDQLAWDVEGDPVGGRPRPPKPAAPPPRPVPQPKAAAPQRAAAPRADAPRPVGALLAAPAKTPTKAAPKPPPPPSKPRPLPVNPLATWLVSTLDADRDGRLNRDETSDAVKHLYIAGGHLHRGAFDAPLLASTFDHVGRLLDPFPPSFDDAAPPEDPLRPRVNLTWAQAIVAHTVAGPESPPRAALDQLLAAADSAFTEADADHNGALDPREASAALDRLVPRP